MYNLKHSQVISLTLIKWNILVSDTRSKGPDSLDIDIVITDFGLSIYHEDNSGENGSARGGRPSFNAPELCDMSITGSTRPTTISDSFSWAASAYNVRVSLLSRQCMLTDFIHVVVHQQGAICR